MRRNRDYLKDARVIVHVSNAGVNNLRIFSSSQECNCFTELLRDALEKMPVSMLMHVLLPEQFQMALEQFEPFAISRFMKKVCEAYAAWFNARTRRSGHVFTRRYNGVPIPEPESLLRLACSIHSAPVDAGVVSGPAKWRYSSYKSYLDGRSEILVDRSVLWSLVGGPAGYARFVECYDPADPRSAKEYLCPGALDFWKKRGLKGRRRRKK